MNGHVITLEKGKDKITYIDVPSITKSLYELQHKVRVKQMIYGYKFAYFSPAMNFEHAIEKGWNVTHFSWKPA